MRGGRFDETGARTGGKRRVGVRSLVAIGLASLTTLLGLSAVPATPQAGAATGAVAVMPLGDSLTGGPGCWRAPLWTELQNSGYTDVDFVGTQPGGGCDLAVWDGDNEGHGGALAIDTADQNLLPGWLTASNPDIVMMNFGTNDIWNRRETADIITAFDTLVDQMRQHNASMRILVAQIAPVAPSGCDTCQPATIELNAAMEPWAATRTTSQSPITLVDHWTGWDPVADTIDGVHQSDSGNQKMAATWFTALTTALGAPVTSPSASASASASGSTPPVTSPSQSPTSTTQSCTATYVVTGSWQGGFQAEIEVTAGPAAIDAWTVAWTLAEDQSITQSWNATIVTSGTAVTATGVAWNRALPASATTSFGLIGTGGGAEPVAVPPVSCIAV
ncbi:MAG: cellulose-binding protein [Dactylosporangium sp.]|nr:cellulose binding domain-containing protein [Dactylosporangium sp.]NNJ60947.1 cellulose-binding protein [Dactylosporangium sp.]